MLRIWILDFDASWWIALLNYFCREALHFKESQISYTKRAFQRTFHIVRNFISLVIGTDHVSFRLQNRNTTTHEPIRIEEDQTGETTDMNINHPEVIYELSNLPLHFDLAKY